MRGAVANVGLVVHRLLSKIFPTPLPWIIPGFSGWPPFRRHFVQNLFIGVCIELVIISLSHFGVPWVVNNQDAALDFMMRLSTNLPAEGKKHPNQVWIDVNERTYRSSQWGGGEPSALPLVPLAKLIEFAVEYEGARYVVVDFTIDGPENPPQSENALQKEFDTQQQKFAADMRVLLEKHKDEHDGNGIHLLFMWAVREPHLQEWRVSRSVRPSVLDALIAGYPNNVHAVAPNFVVSDDHVLRHWKLWESACRHGEGEKSGEGHWVVLPSPQLVLAALLGQHEPPPWSLGVDTKSKGEVSPVCAMNDGYDAEPKEILRDATDSQLADFRAGRWVKDNFGDCYQQDQFTHADCTGAFSQRAAETEAEPATALSNRVYFRIYDSDSLPPSFHRKPKPSWLSRWIGQRPLELSGVPKRSADKILKLSPGEKVRWDASEKENLIAVIGASYTDSRDFYLTPLGEMPGALVLINAIDSLCTVGVLQPPKLWQKLLIIVVILVAVSAAFARLPTFWAATAMMAAIVCLLGPISFWLIKGHGVWVDFTVPIIGIYFHREWEELHERLSRCLPNTTTGESL